jgi:hypothetical protein
MLRFSILCCCCGPDIVRCGRKYDVTLQSWRPVGSAAMQDEGEWTRSSAALERLRTIGGMLRPIRAGRQGAPRRR